MYPYFNIAGVLHVPMYGLCIVLGLAVASALSYRLCKAFCMDFDNFIIIAACTLSLGLFGAKIAYMAVAARSSGENTLFLLLKALAGRAPQNMTGGLVFYGGVIGGAAGYFIGCIIAKEMPSIFAGVMAVDIPLCHAFGRAGCFFAGCCGGILPFPLQLLEALCLIFISIVMYIYLVRRPIKPQRGTKALIAYFFIYPVLRFLCEYLRADTQRGMIGALSTSQALSLLILGVNLIVTIVLVIRSATHSSAAEL